MERSSSHIIYLIVCYGVCVCVVCICAHTCVRVCMLYVHVQRSGCQYQMSSSTDPHLIFVLECVTKP